MCEVLVQPPAAQPAERKLAPCPRPSCRLQGSPLGAELLSKQGLAGGGLPLAATPQPPRFAPEMTAPLPFPGFLPPGAKPAGCATVHQAQQPSLLSSSPPFCCSALGPHLRGEYAGGASCFVQPAAAVEEARPADELDSLVPLPAELL